jgi:hypothetical protein
MKGWVIEFSWSDYMQKDQGAPAGLQESKPYVKRGNAQRQADRMLGESYDVWHMKEPTIKRHPMYVGVHVRRVGEDPS